MENHEKNQGTVHTKLLISQLVITLQYKTWYLSNFKI